MFLGPADTWAVLGALLRRLGEQFPLHLACIVGLLLAYRYRRTAPQACCLAGIACGLILFSSLAHIVLSVSLLLAIDNHRINSVEYQWLTQGVNLANPTAQGFGIVLLVFASIRGRPANPRDESKG
jgi:hypothetical protein